MVGTRPDPDSRTGNLIGGLLPAARQINLPTLFTNQFAVRHELGSITPQIVRVYVRCPSHRSYLRCRAGRRFPMLSSALGDRPILVRDDDSQSAQEREIERWRTARNIVRLLREAGFSCELSNDDAATENCSPAPTR
jgi:hypothetical protein